MLLLCKRWDLLFLEIQVRFISEVEYQATSDISLTENRTRVALQDVQHHLFRVSDSIAKFHGNLVNQKDDSHLLNVGKWMNYIKVSSLNI